MLQKRLASIVVVLLAISTAKPVEAQRLPYFPADAERGADLALPCLACHSLDDMPSGTDPSFRVPRLAGQRAEAIFQALLDYRDGVRQSPIMGPLAATVSVQDMRDLAAFLSASGPYVPDTVDQGTWAHDKVHRDCTICHGESGMGVMAGIPVLTGQHEDYLVHALEAYRDGSRSDGAMTAIASTLAVEEIRLLAEYFAKQSHLEVIDAP